MFRGKCPVGRFLLKIRITNLGCWEWQGSTNGHGYGSFYCNGKHTPSHRFAWINTNGDIPHGLEPDHLCRNRICANPAHIELVTRSENTKRGLAPILLRHRHQSVTHCPKGHPYNEENTYHEKKGRSCKACHREATREWYQRKYTANGITRYQVERAVKISQQ